MATIGAAALSNVRRFAAVAAGALLCTPVAFAGPGVPEQILSVAFGAASHGVPLSDWLTAGTALLLAATAIVMLRRRDARGRRLFGWMLVLVTGSLLLATTGHRIVSDAIAALPNPEISLTVSPGTIDVGPYSQSLSPLVVPVTNNTGRDIQIVAITLNPPYNVWGVSVVDQGTCWVGRFLATNETCTVRLVEAV